MWTLAFSIPLLFLSLTAAEIVPAIRRDAPENYIDKRQSDNPLGKRAVCNQYYSDFCISSSGYQLCLNPDEICCFANTNAGVVPYVCPAGYPYCCPPQNGWPTCGTDISCGIGKFQAASSHPVYTDTKGPKPTGKSASMAPSAAPTTTSDTAVNVPTNPATVKPAESKPNAARSLNCGAIGAGILAAVFLGGLAIVDSQVHVGSDTVAIQLNLVAASSVPLRTGLYKGFDQISEPVEPLQHDSNSTKRSIHVVSRDDCTAIQAVSNDGCYSLSQRCAISLKDFESYNPANGFCDNIQPKQWVCCSKGTLPDTASLGITMDKINDYNKQTWGWGGCTAIQPGDKFCVSSGNPPMPAARGNAVCGPQVLGSLRPTDGTNLKDINPCPLNVCCNVWVQCGSTDDYCILNPADTKNPGTTQPGKNSCVSSCGMNITNNDVGPEQFRRVAYFEAWNANRPCLHMSVTDVPNNFTHIHFAFPRITADYKVNITGLDGEFAKFKNITGIKRIVSFGGWAFSTEAPTYNIFREGVTDANRVTLATNIARFVTDNGLDGVDFDWEYPSAPDIPVRRRLRNQSVSIAAPASYWYLKGFSIKDIGGMVDYIVYMTYDLHGQWDYGNKWSSPNCEEYVSTGPPLPPEFSLTENPLAQRKLLAIAHQHHRNHEFTRPDHEGGVLSNRVVVAVASYVRSFHMAELGCVGSMCTFTEIRHIITGSMLGEGSDATTYHDKDSDSDILVYDDCEWVSYMTDKTKQSRTNWVQGLNFGGTSDRAVDPDKDYGTDGVGDLDPDELEEDGVGPKCDQYKDYNTHDKIAGKDALEPTCAALYTLGVLKGMLNDSMTKYSAVNDGYDSKFQSYTKYLKNGLPELLEHHMYYQNGAGQKYFNCHFVGGGKDWSGSCPVPVDVRGHQPFGVWKITMTLRDSYGFYKDLNNKTGILQDWIEFFTYKVYSNCQPEPCNNLVLTIVGQARLKKQYDIPNPKDVVSKAMANQGGSLHALMVQVFNIGMGLWNGSNQDVVQSLAVPVFLIQNAINGMENAKELGEKEEKEEAKNKLLTILSAVFLVVPFLGGGAAAISAGAGTLARLIAMGGVATNGGLALQTVIENPNMVPFAVMDLLSLGRLKTPGEFLDAAKFRNAMKDTDVAALGTKFSSQDALVQKIVRTCKKA
ncbi:glycoside hydrolase family 18 protein [Periconia macrospinosa]|uniref:chitinase n=1 Tax=Periconia macrospinosa TaxID=97972 RepID=A0A2V1E1S5_9PLEO|nr:glycoside hydrolase family 18 protein [Periconia macrospinosa]